MQVLVEDKVFVVCMVLSVGLYAIAWANPEPVFSKAAAAAVTLALALAFGVAELVHTGHKGPHPERYHQAVYDFLLERLAGCNTKPVCRARLLEALKTLARNVCTPGTLLHQLVTKTP